MAMILDRVAAPGILLDTLQAGVERAQQQRGPVLVSVTQKIAEQDPLAFFVRSQSLAAERVFWEQPSAGWALAGVGAATRFTADGPDRFATIDRAWRDLLATAVIAPGPDAPVAGPVLMGGFAFDPQRPPTDLWSGFPPGLMVLPRFLLRATTAGSWLTTNLLLWPDSDAAGEAARLGGEHRVLLAAEHGFPQGPGARSPGAVTADVQSAVAWQATVRAATVAIRAGHMEKVVLAREVAVQMPAPVDLGAALDRLRTAYPNCYTFAIAHGERCFLGASPERLVRATAGQVQVTCLAGSTARGATPDEDASLGATLLASAKNRHEHALVAHSIEAALSGVCARIELPATPQLLKLSNVQHLYTPVQARMAPGRRLLELVARLHPTPAVGGTPRVEALAWIRAHEGWDRGWYAGPVGWLDAAGNGEFAVALRSGLVAGTQARLFAGCGIVGDSDPAAEYAESQLKLRPMLNALGA